MIKSDRQHCPPMFVSTLDDRRTLRRLVHEPYVRDGIAGHSEGWLQTLVADCPGLLPIHEIEPGFGRLASICLELPTPAGPVDNLFLTPEGNIVLVECKLWRNPEARREVVAQIMDYAQGMAGWSYQDLEDAARRANPEVKGLYDAVGDDLDEPTFVDAVSRNLSLGRVLLVVLGDGIREGAEQLTGMLQAHAGFHFSLALVEMPFYRLPDQGYVVVPRILARTVTIERGIVTVSGDSRMIRIESPPEVVADSPAISRRSISVEQGLETLAVNAPDTLQRLKPFLAEAGDKNVFLEPATKSLVLRWYAPEGTGFSLGMITLEGRFDTDNVGWMPDAIGRLDLAHAYQADLAALIHGSVRQTSKPKNWYIVASDGRRPNATELLSRPNELWAAIDRYTDALSMALEERG